MKSGKKESRQAALETAAPPPASRDWIYAAAFGAAFLVALILYSPALHGPFLFDDNYLPFDLPNHPATLRGWLGVRPLLMLSYWLNFHVSGSEETYGYHLVNIILHAFNSLLIFFLVRRFLDMLGTAARRRDLVAGFAAAIFLLHPVQTEAVAYVAGRSEALSVMFLLSAFTVFLYRPAAVISWRLTGAVLLLFGAALATKEHTIALMPLLLLTDYWWNPGFSFAGIRRNWKLYVPVVLGAAGGVLMFWRLITNASTAGFGMREFTWYQYFFTQCRAFFVYLRLFVYPAGQSLDYEVAISRTLYQHGAVFGLAAILALVGLAWYYRRRFPLAAYGFFAYIVLMAPTSSFLPIRDPITERRLYLPMIGLLLILAEGLRRVRVERPKVMAALAAVLAIAAVLTYNRSQVWANAVTLWEDNARGTPTRWKVRFQLAHAYFNAGRCADAVREYGVASRLVEPRYDMLIDWGLAYDCANQPEQALDRFRVAATLEPSAHAYTQMAMVYAKRSRWPEALDALAMAERLDPGFPFTYVYRGDIRRATGDAASAVTEYRHALSLDPQNQQALEGLRLAERQPGTAPR